MSTGSFRVVNPDRYDIATEVFLSAKRVLQAVGFDEVEVQDLFKQAASMPKRGPIWLERPKEGSKG